MNSRVLEDWTDGFFPSTTPESPDAGDLFHRKHEAAMTRAREILNYKSVRTSDVEEALNVWALQMTRKDTP